ncbi:oxidoreductase domain protein [Kribbella flavida DSM 17836]|uniref:Oxidoreductase domain protein n=1 Tax=Kribbella flavida (strain DSM 17836 / JCM 10339 / NBRC 14399) TaxID=479435 RepID=D2PZL7_KRIFD|nr:Gfo/Idh/MocA family oxidoreductase [Kribbella flavida]ADB35583.1 oxidoreductase domain protein [Kribbella flavida DSM 17836]
MTSLGSAPTGRATNRPIGVGVVGLSAAGGWGAGAHLPAMVAADGFELRGLVGSTDESARAASRRYGAPSYASVEQLAASDDVDLVVITVKTPSHRDLVRSTTAARKPVFCEWPFAVDHSDAVELAASAAGVATFVGLQGRSSPHFRWLRDLVAAGYVGELLSVTVSSTVTEWGGPVSEGSLYTLDRDQGGSMLGIGFGHAIDPVLMVVGELVDVVATTATRHPRVPLGGTGRLVPMTSVDQIAVSGTLPGGAVLSAHQRGGTASGPGFWLRIDGSRGTLEATARNHPHIAPVTVRGALGGHPLTELTLPAAYDEFPRLAGSHLHTLAHAYARIGHQLRGGATEIPDFAHAVTRHRLLDAITESAATGRRIFL